MKNRNVWIVIGVAVVLVVIVGLVAVSLLAGFGHTAYTRPMMRDFRYPMGGIGLGEGLLGLLCGLGLLGIGVLLVAAIIRMASHSRASSEPSLPPARQEESAMEILRQRYARGEITREEFDLMKETLTAGTTGQTPTEGTV
jgi:putative membrane protein